METVYEKSLRLHEENKGKIEVVSKVKIETMDDLSLAYTPGVAQSCKEIYKDENNECYYFSPYCPHLKCIIEFNKKTQTWDCPCHGSRFTETGKVIENPATENLNIR